MSKVTALLTGIAVSLTLCTAAQAATVVSGVIYEGGVGPAKHAPKADKRLGDFDAKPENDFLIVVDDISIWGGVAHSRKSRYTDAWTMDFGTKTYKGVFNWQNVEKNRFDGALIIDGETTMLEGSGSVSLTGLTGVVVFEVDPRVGKYGPKPREAATWDLQLVTAPLPAGAWLMLAGLAGLGWMRRAKARG